MSNKIYITSDIHGEINKFASMLNLIQFSSTDKMYILGDVLDRGDAPIDLLRLIINIPNIELIKGNHELMFEGYLGKPMPFNCNQTDYLKWYKQFGGNTTIKQFEKLRIKERLVILNYLETLPLYVIVDKYLLVHSGLTLTQDNRSLSLDGILRSQKEGDFLWHQQDFFGYKGLDTHTIVFGHFTTPRLREVIGESIPEEAKIWHDKVYQDKIGIDCGACFEGGRLGCLCLNDMQEYYC